LGTFSRYLWDFWNEGGFPLVTNPLTLFEEGRVGPGAARFARGESFVEKLFSSPLSCSSENLAKWFRIWIGQSPTWCAGEEIRQSMYGAVKTDVCSRLSFVAKNDVTSRAIATEPSINAYAQQGFDAILRRRLKRFFGLDLVIQQRVNRWYARWGSQRDHLSTIDLSSASDTISLAMCKRFLPPDMMRVIELCRSSRVELPNGDVTESTMVSTMGNAFTFSLQTIIFSCVVAAAFSFRDKPLKWRGYPNAWGVNGDDIVVPKSVTADVISLLTLLGFEVNGDKTFTEGPFRESCGGDFFLGRNIRGVYIQSTSTQEARYSAFNQLVRFSAKTGILLPRLLLKLFPDRKRLLLVPRWEDSSAGIHVPISIVRRFLRLDANGSYVYRARVPVTLYADIYDGRVWKPKGHKSISYNPHGLWLAMLNGSLSGSSPPLVKQGVTARISLRPREGEDVRYRTKRRVAPNWDCSVFLSTFESPDSDVDWAAWETTLNWVFRAARL